MGWFHSSRVAFLTLTATVALIGACATSPATSGAGGTTCTYSAVGGEIFDALTEAISDARRHDLPAVTKAALKARDLGVLLRETSSHFEPGSEESHVVSIVGTLGEQGSFLFDGVGPEAVPDEEALGHLEDGISTARGQFAKVTLPPTDIASPCPG